MIQKIEHVTIIVTDMDRSIAFYNNVFGFEVRTRGTNPRREMAFLYLPQDRDLEIELIRDLVPGETYAEIGIVNHLAFRVQDIDKAIAACREQGIALLSEGPSPTLDGGKMILFHGPDKELLQLIEPSPDRVLGNGN